jgi:4-diphosphocytidyl-2-C-methyl-D-erythritol kinase
VSFRIQRANAAHIEVICAIEREAVQMFRDHAAWRFYSRMSIPEDLLAEEIRRGFVWVAVEETSAEVVGFVWLDVALHGDFVCIAEIDVLPAFHRRGIGSALLQHACAWARDEGYRRIDLGTLPDIPWNAPFYVKHGFAVVSKDDPDFAYARELDRENGLPEGMRVYMSRTLSS